MIYVRNQYCCIETSLWTYILPPRPFVVRALLQKETRHTPDHHCWAESTTYYLWKPDLLCFAFWAVINVHWTHSTMFLHNTCTGRCEFIYNFKSDLRTGWPTIQILKTSISVRKATKFSGGFPFVFVFVKRILSPFRGEAAAAEGSLSLTKQMNFTNRGQHLQLRWLLYNISSLVVDWRQSKEKVNK